MPIALQLRVEHLCATHFNYNFLFFFFFFLLFFFIDLYIYFIVYYLILGRFGMHFSSLSTCVSQFHWFCWFNEKKIQWNVYAVHERRKCQLVTWNSNKKKRKNSSIRWQIHRIRHFHKYTVRAHTKTNLVIIYGGAQVFETCSTTDTETTKQT